MQRLKDTRKKVILYGEQESLAYSAAFMPSFYAMMSHVLLELKYKCPDFRPSSCLDFGTGPGTAIWASHELWPDSIEKYLAVDLSDDMTNAARDIMLLSPSKKSIEKRKSFDADSDIDDEDVNSGPNTELVDKIQFQRYLSSQAVSKKYDLVMANCVLSELQNDQSRRILLGTLWKKTNDVLVIVEHGTKESFRLIADARQHILDGAKQDGSIDQVHVVAPCSHELECPLRGHKKKWCDFGIKIERTREMREIKQMKTSTEKGTYSYVILRKRPRPSIVDNPEYSAGRILNYSRVAKTVMMDICDADGQMKHKTIYKKPTAKLEYRRAKQEMAAGCQWHFQNDDEPLDK